jgi:hypothetical protein
MTNELADMVNTKLLTYHARVYRNNAPSSPTFPYVVFNVGRANDSVPTTDYIVDIKIYDKNDGTVSVRTIETLGDTIDAGLNLKVLSGTYNVHFTRDIRQHDDDESLAGVQFVNLQYTARLY